MRIMRPEVTEKAAIYAKARITSSIETIYNFAATPDDRADLARSQAFLPGSVGGLDQGSIIPGKSLSKWYFTY